MSLSTTGGASANSLRARAQGQLSRGLVQGGNESFLSFGKRLLQVTRDSLLPETPESAVQNQASWHLLSYIRDPTVRGIISAARLNSDYHTLLDQTVALIESNSASRQSFRRHEYQRSPNRFDGNRQPNRFPIDNQMRFHPAPVPHNIQPSPSRYVPNAIPPDRSNIRVSGGNAQPVRQSSQPVRRVNAVQTEPTQDEIQQESGAFGISTVIATLS